MNQDHQVPLDPAADIALWRAFVLRSAGFPARFATLLDSPEAVRASLAWMEAVGQRDALVKKLKRELLLREREATGAARAALRKLGKKLARGAITDAPISDDGLRAQLALLGEQRNAVDRARASLDEVFGREIERLADAIRDILRTGRFREAIAWESPGALEGIDKLLAADPSELGQKKMRNRLYCALTYLQRFCVKNDTVGFFGPIVWGTFSEDVADIEIEHREPIVRRHEHHFEAWAINDLARMIGEQPEAKPWLPVRRLPSIATVGQEVKFPMQPPVERGEAVARALSAGDGSRNSREVAAELAAAGVAADEATQLLDRLEAEGLILRSAELPMSYHSEVQLAELLARVPDEAAAAHRARLERMRAARDELAAACGNADRVRDGIVSIEALFARETGRPGRRAGSFYAARSPVFQEGERNTSIRLGRRVLADLRQPLGVVLSVARWYTQSVALRLQARVDAILTRMGVARAEFLPIFFEVIGELPALSQAVASEVTQRWAQAVLPLAQDGLLDADAARAAVEKHFPTLPTIWELGRHASPDLLVGASDVEAIRRGDYFVVLGELHAAANTLLQSCFAWAHDPRMLADWTRRDVVGVPIIGDWQEPSATVRGTRVDGVYGASWVIPHQRHNVAWSNDSLVPLAGLHVERNADGVPRGRYSGGDWSIAEMFNPLSCIAACRAFRFEPDEPRGRRLRIGHLVVQRAHWTMRARELSFVGVSHAAERFALQLAWAQQHQIPRHVFVRVQSELKPLYFDLESPLYAEVLARLVRNLPGDDPQVTFSEMLPTPDQLWLTDAQNNRYTNELRCVAVDNAR